MAKSNFEISDFMRTNKRSYPYGLSANEFCQKVRNVMKRDADLTLSAAVTLVQAKAGSNNNPH